MWKWYALLSALFAAVTALCAKAGVKDIDSNLATAIRVAFILIITWGVVLVTGTAKDILGITRSTWGFLALSAVATGLSWLFYFKALQVGEVSKVAPLDKLSVPLAMLLAFLIFGESVTGYKIAGGLLITIGSLLLLK